MFQSDSSVSRNAVEQRQPTPCCTAAGVIPEAWELPLDCKKQEALWRPHTLNGQPITGGAAKHAAMRGATPSASMKRGAADLELASQQVSLYGSSSDG